jgi:hypothetical protein
MATAYVAYTKPKGIIKSVSVESSGEIDELGFQLNDYYKDLSDVKELISSSIDYIDDGDVVYFEDLDDVPEELYEYEEYEDKEDFVNHMSGSAYYYLFENDKWFVCKPNQDEFNELESVIEDEY